LIDRFSYLETKGWNCHWLKITICAECGVGEQLEGGEGKDHQPSHRADQQRQTEQS
jgi:hypothetical protein